MVSTPTPTNDTLIFTVVIPPEPEEIKKARDLVAFAFQQWGLDGYVAMTVVTELATNAYRHGSQPGDSITVRTYRGGDGLPVLEVWDESPDKPHVHPLNLAGESGRGLYLMEQICRSWDHRPSATGGKVVYAIIDPTTH